MKRRGKAVAVAALLVGSLGGIAVQASAPVMFENQQKLVAPDRADTDLFGASVAVFNDMILVGTPRDDDPDDSGSVYVYSRQKGVWALRQKLRAETVTYLGKYGSSVAIDGDTAAVTAPREGNGAVYVYRRSDTGLVFTQKILYEGASESMTSVAIDGNTLVIGASSYNSNTGHVYVYINSEGIWSLQQVLQADDPKANAMFGWSVAIDGDTLLIGAHRADAISPGDEKGAAYFFTRTGTTWTQSDKVHASNVNQFGYAVALDKDSAIVGTASSGRNDTLHVSMFSRSGSGWVLSSQLENGQDEDYATTYFGSAVAILDGVALVGAPWSYGYSGRAFSYTHSLAGWTEEATKTTSAKYDNDKEYAHAVAQNRDMFVIGAIKYDVSNDPNGNNTSDNGAVYLYGGGVGFSGTLGAGVWTMFGAPCELDADSDTIGELFGYTLNSAEYGNRWIVYTYESAANQYHAAALTDPVVQGAGYWLLSLDAAGYSAWGTSTSYPISQAEGCTSADGCYAIDLALPDNSADVRYTMVGFPGSADVDWSSVRFVTGEAVYSPSEAKTHNLASKSIWKYNGSSYDTYDDGTAGMTGILHSKEGFWVKTLGGAAGAGSLKLLIPVN